MSSSIFLLAEERVGLTGETLAITLSFKKQKRLGVYSFSVVILCMTSSMALIFAAKPHTVQPHGALQPTLSKDNEAFFEQVFKEHFKNLHAYACSILRDEVMAEEMVQNVFCRLWEKQEQIDIRQSYAAYLYRSVHNECLNYLKHLKVRAAHEAYTKTQAAHYEDATGKIMLSDLQQRLDGAMKELPEQCRTVFQLSRFEELKYQEIADRLQISVKTVENHMGKALRLLRQKLADFLPAIIIFYILFKQ